MSENAEIHYLLSCIISELEQLKLAVKKLEEKE
jgi:hypothetical protein